MKEQIPAKQNLGNRKLISDVIPQGVTGIGDWAYAYCVNLEEIAIPSSVRSLGRDVFTGCTALKRVYLYESGVYGEASKTGDTAGLCAGLNAIAVRFFSSPMEVLIPDVNVTACIMKKWDEQCLEFLELPDDTGFSPFLAGGEEDYSEGEDQLTKYRQERQRSRAYVLFARLLAAEISELPFERDSRGKMTELFRCCPGAIPLLNEIDGHYTEAAGLYYETGLVTAETLPAVFEFLDPEKVELRSALINRGNGGMMNDLEL